MIFPYLSRPWSKSVYALGLVLQLVMMPARAVPPGVIVKPLPADMPAYGGLAQASVLLPNGKVLLAGTKSGTPLSVKWALVRRYNTDGSLDASFGASGTATVSAVEAWQVSSDATGRILVAGIKFNGTSNDYAAIRYSAAGVVDTTFGNKGVVTADLGGVESGYCGTMLQNGQALITGAPCTLFRFTSTGKPEPTFGDFNRGYVEVPFAQYKFVTVSEQADQKILALEETNNFGSPAYYLLRFSKTGVLDTSFGSGRMGMGTRCNIALQADSKIVVAGGTSMERLLPTGAADSTFGNAGQVDLGISIAGPAHRIGMDSLGRILVPGRISNGSDDDAAVERYLPDGTLDASFGTGGRVVINVSNQSDEALHVMPGANGTFRVFGVANSYASFFLANFSADGEINQPDIAVEQPAASGLTDGGSAPDFGSVAGSAKASKIFTIKNLGVVTLSGIALSIDGTHASDFAVTASPPTALAAGGSTTFTVTFTPSDDGVRTASLHIASNDPNESSFDLTLTGTGTPGLAFRSAINFVDEEDGSVLIPIERYGSTAGAVSVKVTSTNGTAGAADFTPLVNTIVNFPDGDATALVPVIINPDALVEGNETFTLTLSDPQGGVGLGSPVTTQVRIVEPNDATKPGVVISTPAAAASINEGASVSVTGSASDTRGIRSVQFSVNGSPFLDATVTLGATGTTATFTAPLNTVITPLLPGTNTLMVKSIDTRGNESLVTTRSFAWIVMRPLSVQINGVGTVPLPVPAGSFRVNFPYTIKALPGVGQVFDGWTMNGVTGTGITPAMLELPSLTFTHREGLVLSAQFRSNPFTASLIGSFNGLILPSASVPAPGGSVASHETVGALSNLTVQSNGAFSGTVKVDGLSMIVAGIFDNSGMARFGPARATTMSLVRTTKPSLEVALHLDMTGTTNRITGTMTQRLRSAITAQSVIEADRAFYNATTKMDALLPATTLKSYTMALRSRASHPGFATGDYPQGDGIATGTVRNDGATSFAFKLADHIAFSASAPLSKTNTWPVFAQLYLLKGSFAAWMTMNPTLADTDLTGTDVHWFRPWQNVQWYPWGWPEGIDVEIIGARYTPPALPGLLPVDLINGNAVLTFSEGGISGQVIKNVNIHPTTSVVTRVPAMDASFAISLVPTTGAISGTFFTHSDGSKPAWQGVLLQKGANKGGYGYFMTVSPRVIDGTGLSGKASLQAR